MSASFPSSSYLMTKELVKKNICREGRDVFVFAYIRQKTLLWSSGFRSSNNTCMVVGDFVSFTFDHTNYKNQKEGKIHLYLM